MIPPKEDGEFVANMEDVLEIYGRPYDASRPLVCMDEQPIQLLKESRLSIPATQSHGKRVDYEYERAGTASIFLFVEPLGKQRQVHVRPRRTKVDWAQEVEALIRTQYADAEKIILVCDNLNTHTRGAFYQAFSAEKAQKIINRIEFHYTPKHGSWLNIAESELSVMTRQSLRHQRFSSIESLRLQIQAWAAKRNKRQRGIDWQFTVGDGRCKLKSIYPKI